MKVIRWLDKHVEEVLMALFLTGIITMMSIHVFFRYVMKSPLTWTEECTRYCFIWFVYSGIGYGLRNGTHIRINILEIFHPKIVPVFSLIQAVVTTAFFAYLIPPIHHGDCADHSAQPVLSWYASSYGVCICFRDSWPDFRCDPRHSGPCGLDTHLHSEKAGKGS